MDLAFHTLDVFTSRRFGGNPLAVVLGADGLTTEAMQTVAREFNLSETIFVQAPDDPAHTAKVRIFFPTGEIPFAGHPTIGCAILLAELKNKPGCSFETVIRLEEVAGLVPVKVSRIGGPARATLTAPVVPFAGRGQLPDIDATAAALGLAPVDIGFGTHGLGLWQGGPTFFYVPLGSREALARVRPIEPHWSRMTAMTGTRNAYVYVAKGDDPETSFRARMFAPAAGVVEDPATGSASAILAAQLLASGALREGVNRFRLEQGYEMGRPSDLTLEADVRGGALAAVRVSGEAVRIMRGALSL